MECRDDEICIEKFAAYAVVNFRPYTLISLSARTVEVKCERFAKSAARRTALSSV